jgi:hypothetical protein
MSTLLKAGDSEPEQPLREGWLVKQSGGAAATRGRRRSVGEIMKKWDERYFVLTTQRLYYFKTMEVRARPWHVVPQPGGRCRRRWRTARLEAAGLDADAVHLAFIANRTSSVAAIHPASSRSRTTWSRAPRLRWSSGAPLHPSRRSRWPPSG